MRQPYKIYRDPIPEPKPRRNSIIPFARMNVGDHVFVPAAAETSAEAVAHMARQWEKRNRTDWRFLVSVVDGRIAVWRVK
jgi:hypothetical protein